MTINWQEMAFHFLGGLGLFLFSIKYMGDGLQQAAGERLRFYIDKYTSNPLLGILVGIVMTALIQSSSGVTVIAVGLVMANLLTLKQAIGIVMGANIGTTVTSILIGFNLGAYALPMIFVGAMLLFFTNKRHLNNLGRIVFGIGGIFFSLTIMSDAMAPLRDVSSFQTYLATLGDKPIQGVFIGSVLTAIIQSSAAIIGILQGLYAESLLQLQGAIPILLGSNIGTCITVVLAAIGANIAAKRVAAAHVLFNVIGTVIFIILLTPFTHIMQWLEGTLKLSPEMTVALAHGSFNVTNTIFLFPFINFLAYLVTKLIPGEDEGVKYESLYLERIVISQSPAIAIGNAKKEFLHLGSYTVKSLSHAYQYFTTSDTQEANKVTTYEKTINTIDDELTRYLIELSREELSPSESDVLGNLLDASRDLEKIGDHAFRLVEVVNQINHHHTRLSAVAMQEVDEIHSLTLQMIKDVLQAIEASDSYLAQKLIDQCQQVKSLERHYRKKHIKRLNNEQCTPQAGVSFIDMISHYSRVSDHVLNLAEKVTMGQI
ncbi:Na/Pi cotransporter family protein [Streptococcus merionis]|uniref:Na/Pi cotransporter family protein n=1 Tax=Streptococcus merionis TaxID=400065 RepID=UPI0026E996B3|nr:Na/Pi cotransporter family protein [Streptococcus merionis]